MIENLEDDERVPQKWIDLKIDEAVKQGWRPRIIKRRDTQYLTLRLGNQERSLGLATDENVQLLYELFPELRGKLHSKTRPIRSSTILSTKIAKPKQLPATTHLTLETLQWYKYLQEKAEYPGTIDEFLNESVDTLFREHYGLELAVIIEKKA